MAAPEGYWMLVVAERFGVLPDDVESRMSEWWFERAVTFIQAESIANKRKYEKK